MVGVAAGLASCGKTVFASFLLCLPQAAAFEQILQQHLLSAAQC